MRPGGVRLDPAADRRGLPDRPLPDAGHPRRRLAAVADRRPAPEPGARRRLDPGGGDLVPQRGGDRGRSHRRRRARASARAAGRPGRATVAGLPMLALMIGYTVLSLWIIAQPIVVEPGVAPAALRIGSANMTEVSIAVAVAAGLLSFISPCVLALLPVYLAFLGNAAVADDSGTRRRHPRRRRCRRRSSSWPASASSSSSSGRRSASSAGRCSGSRRRARWPACS